MSKTVTFHYICEFSRVIPVYYNVDPIFIGLAIVSIYYDDIAIKIQLLICGKRTILKKSTYMAYSLTNSLYCHCITKVDSAVNDEPKQEARVILKLLQPQKITKLR